MPQRKETDESKGLLKKSKEELLKLAKRLSADVKKGMTKLQLVKIISDLTSKAEDAQKIAKMHIEKSKEKAKKEIEKTKRVAKSQIEKTKRVAEKVKSVSKGIQRSVNILKRTTLARKKGRDEPEARIVLEQISTKPVHGTGDVEPSKYDMGDMSRRKFVEEALGTLPESYDIDTIFVIARDPEWIFCYWDISRDTIRHYLTQSIDNRLYIKISDVTNIIYDGGNANRYLLYEIPYGTKNWYAFVDSPERDFVVEIVVKSRHGFLPILRSKTVRMPPSTTSSGEVRFVTIPFDIPLARIKEIVGPRLRDISELAYLLSKLQEEGTELPFPYVSPLPEGVILLEELWGPDGQGIRRYLKGSEEILERLRKALKWNLSSSDNLIKER
ncbi:MAG: DUF4912 domain-containing protein [Deltaproteobacteria bacterium]|nr:DUF4912 domain-containing protein [Deltaproteobacteria bacterium]